MRTYKRLCGAVLVFAGALTAPEFVNGQGVGNVGVLPSVFPGNPAVGGWIIGTYSVDRDPNGGPWIKNLVNPNGGNVVAQPGQVFTLQESLVIGGTLPWSDWHEQILTPGWEWAVPTPTPPMFFANSAPAPGLTTNVTPGSPTAGGTIDFYFNSLPVGTKIDIRKQLLYLGGATGVPFDGVIRIAEYPTPEPATLGLLAVGSLVALRRRARSAR